MLYFEVVLLLSGTATAVEVWATVATAVLP